jgi:hypothetical protein
MFCSASFTQCGGVGGPLEIRIDDTPLVAMSPWLAARSGGGTHPSTGCERARREARGSCRPTKASLRYLLRVCVPA